jgi:hypothetical protein
VDLSGGRSGGGVVAADEKEAEDEGMDHDCALLIGV